MGSSFGGNVALQLALRHPNKFRAVIPVEAAAHAPGFYLDWWRHPHANAAQVCASGTWDRRWRSNHVVSPVPRMTPWRDHRDR